jgi:tRNA(His) 5'-end guanylyltransferase
MKDDLGTRMKEQYENRTRYLLPRRTYTIIRLDGKAFHTFTKGMRRPYDAFLMGMMDKTAEGLVATIQGVQFAYTQSDEISLLLTDFDKPTTDAWFDGNIQKIVSVSASIATAAFNAAYWAYKIQVDKTELWDLKTALFDSRVFTIPDAVEVENYFIWRQKDAVRNSIAMTAQSLYSHKELNGKSSNEQQEMIHQKGQNWNDMPDGFKRGRMISYEIIKGSDLDEHGEWKAPDCSWQTKPAFDFLKERENLTDLIPKYNQE